MYIDDYLVDNEESTINNIDEVLDLNEALEKLDAKYKTVIILKYFEDMTLESISKMLKLPLSTIKTHLYRALEKLKMDLKEGKDIEL